MAIKKLRQVIQHGLFIVEIAHDALVQTKSPFDEIAHAHQKGHGPRAAHEPRGLGVHKARGTRIEVLQLRVAGGKGDVLRLALECRAQLHDALSVVQRVVVANEIEAALGIADDLAGNVILQRVGARIALFLGDLGTSMEFRLKLMLR